MAPGSRVNARRDVGESAMAAARLVVSHTATTLSVRNPASGASSSPGVKETPAAS